MGNISGHGVLMLPSVRTINNYTRGHENMNSITTQAIAEKIYLDTGIDTRVTRVQGANDQYLLTAPSTYYARLHEWARHALYDGYLSRVDSSMTSGITTITIHASDTGKWSDTGKLTGKTQRKGLYSVSDNHDTGDWGIDFYTRGYEDAVRLYAAWHHLPIHKITVRVGEEGSDIASAILYTTHTSAISLSLLYLGDI